MPSTLASVPEWDPWDDGIGIPVRLGALPDDPDTGDRDLGQCWYCTEWGLWGVCVKCDLTLCPMCDRNHTPCL